MGVHHWTCIGTWKSLELRRSSMSGKSGTLMWFGASLALESVKSLGWFLAFFREVVVDRPLANLLGSCLPILLMVNLEQIQGQWSLWRCDGARSITSLWHHFSDHILWACRQQARWTAGSVPVEQGCHTGGGGRGCTGYVGCCIYLFSEIVDRKWHSKLCEFWDIGVPKGPEVDSIVVLCSGYSSKLYKNQRQHAMNNPFPRFIWNTFQKTWSWFSRGWNHIFAVLRTIECGCCFFLNGDGIESEVSPQLREGIMCIGVQRDSLRMC